MGAPGWSRSCTCGLPCKIPGACAYNRIPRCKPVLLVVHPLHLWRSGPAGGQAGGIPSAAAAACAGARCKGTSPSQTSTPLTVGDDFMHICRVACYSRTAPMKLTELLSSSSARKSALRSLRKHPAAAPSSESTLSCRFSRPHPTSRHCSPTSQGQQHKLSSVLTVSRVADQEFTLGQFFGPFDVAPRRRPRICNEQYVVADGDSILFCETSTDN